MSDPLSGYTLAQLDDMIERIRKAVRVGEERRLNDVAKELGVPRKVIIALEEGMDDFCMNVARGFHGQVFSMPKRDWTLERIDDF